MLTESISSVQIGKFVFSFSWEGSDIRIMLFYKGELVSDCLAYHHRVEVFYHYLEANRDKDRTLGQYLKLMARLGEPVMDYTYFRSSK